VALVGCIVATCDGLATSSLRANDAGDADIKALVGSDVNRLATNEVTECTLDSALGALSDEVNGGMLLTDALDIDIAFVESTESEAKDPSEVASASELATTLLLLPDTGAVWLAPSSRNCPASFEVGKDFVI